MCLGASFLTSFVIFSGRPLNKVFPPAKSICWNKLALKSISTFEILVVIISGKAKLS